MATTSATGTEFSGELPPALEGGEGTPPGVGPWRLAGRRLRRNKVALFFGGLFLLILVLCLLAPVYSHDVAHAGPADIFNGKVHVGNKDEYVLSLTGIPIGPSWHSKFFFGADELGRDVAVRVLYGGRNSLEVGAGATLITMVLGTLLGMLAGYLRGLTDGVIRLALDVIWSFPAVLLGVALGVQAAISKSGSIGPFKGLSIPMIVIGLVYIPYVGRPVRAQVLQLREREFVDAARQQGLSHMRIMLSEILPNLTSTIIVFVPLILANAILLEAALSYLGAGIQPPNPSWGTMISEGIPNIYSSFHLVLVPGIMLVVCVLSINIFGDGMRDAFDPRAKVRIAH